MTAPSSSPRVIRLLYFAVLRDLLGRAEERLELPDEVRHVGALRSFLEVRETVFSGRLSVVRFAIDEAFAEDGDLLRDGAVVALIPPVAGG